MDEGRPFLRCFMCGDLIGVHKPIWLEFADDSLHRSSYLKLGKHPGHDPSRLWHLDCLVPELATQPDPR